MQQAGFWPRELPVELWVMIAGPLLEYCAILTAQEQVHESGSTEGSIIDLTQSLHASYVKMDGRFYIKGLRNTAKTDIKEKGHIILPPPITQGVGEEENRGKNIFVAEDHLGIRQIVLVSPEHCDEWCRTHPGTPGAWWKHISRDDIPSSLVTKSDANRPLYSISILS